MRSGWICAVLLLLAETVAGQAFRVVISEVLPDPTPPVGLPPQEFAELTNVSGKAVDISGWKLSNGRTIAEIPDSTILQPDSLLILCPAAGQEAFTFFGRTVALTPFPALANEGDTVMLIDAGGQVVHAMQYHPQMWARDRSNGGWSLEMRQLRGACSLQGNWLTAIDPSGGTPGRTNSVATQERLEGPFTLLHAWCPDNMSAVLVFNDAVDIAAASRVDLLSITSPLTVAECHALGPFYNELSIQFNSALEPGHRYQVDARRFPGCLQQLPGGNNDGIVVLSLPDSGQEEIVINEMMNDPPPGGSDYVELFNRGDKVIDLFGCRLATRNQRGDIVSGKNIVIGHRYLFPGSYLVVTEDEEWLQRQYHTRFPENIVEVPSLPSWPNEKGTIVLTGTGNQVIDELSYSDEWHFPLIRNKDGVALERRQSHGLTQDPQNWHSAALHAGYGTPGYLNSQDSRSTVGNSDQIWLEPEMFSPDGNGPDDQCLVRYRFREAGTVCTIRIYAINGQLVREVVNNGLCGITGQFRWDGRNGHGKELPAGIYVVVTDSFRLNGEVRRFRNAVTIGR